MVELSLWQDVPGSSFDPTPARSTLGAIRDMNMHIQEATATAALRSETLCFLPESFAWPPAISADELNGRLTIRRIILHAEGGAVIEYVVSGMEAIEFQVSVTNRGVPEDVIVHGAE
jgi:hypothetical protein